VKEHKRLRVMVELDAGRVTGHEIADVLGVSLQHIWRFLAAFREEGAAGLAHGPDAAPFTPLDWTRESTQAA
jgi:predicted transcriptional regulator